jgi:hypothetical protein
MKNTFLLLLFFCYRATAQLPVDKERHHTVVFENSQIRLLEGVVPPHDTTPAHVHAANGVVIFLSPSTFAIQPVGGQPVRSSVKPGDVKYVNYGDKPVNHIVWTEGATALHFFVLELKTRQRVTHDCTMPVRWQAERLWQQQFVSAYAVNLHDSDKYLIPEMECACLFIDIAGEGRLISSGKTREIPAKGFAFFPAGTDIKIAAASRQGMRGVLLLLK